MHALAGRFENRAHERDGRALAVGAGDMDHRRQTAFGMTERREQALDAAERQIDPLRMQRQQPRLDRRPPPSPVGRVWGLAPERGVVTPAPAG